MPDVRFLVWQCGVPPIPSSIMRSSSASTRAYRSLLVLAVLGLLASEGMAQEAAPDAAPPEAPAAESSTPPSVPECMAWHASGQKLRYHSKLLESREPLRGCSH